MGHRVPLLLASALRNRTMTDDHQRLPPAYLDTSDAAPSMPTHESHLCRKMGCPNRATVDGMCEEHASSQYLDSFR